MKKVLLIAGGGSIGTYVAEECLRLGYMVDIICLEDKISDNENLKYYKADATVDYLSPIISPGYGAIIELSLKKIPKISLPLAPSALSTPISLFL